MDDQAAPNYLHDLIHELSRLHDAVWRYDEYVVNAQKRPEAQKLWKKVKKQTKENADQLKKAPRGRTGGRVIWIASLVCSSGGAFGA